MKKLYYLFNKYNTVFIITILIFCSNLIIKTVIQNIQFKNELNAINNAKSIRFSFSESEEFTTDNLIKEIENNNDIISLESHNIVFHIPGDVKYGKAIYSKVERNDIPLINGRFFNIDDTQNYTNTIVLGKNLEKYSQIEDNKKYVYIGEKKLEVIGIMGNETRKTSYDETFFINLSGFILPNNNLESLYNYKIIGLPEENTLKQIIRSIFEEYNINSLEFVSSKNHIDIFEIIDSILMYIPIIFIVVIFIVANLFNIFRFWWENNKNKFIVNRMVGATKFNIVQLSINILFKQFIIAMISTYFINSLLYIFISNYFSNYNFENSLISIIITTILLFLLCIIIMVVPVYKLVNKEINRNIRGI